MKSFLPGSLVAFCLSLSSSFAAPVGICLHSDGQQAPASKIECFEFERTERVSSGTRFFLTNGKSVLVSDYRNRGVVMYPGVAGYGGDSLAKLLETYETHATQISSTRPYLNPYILKLRAAFVASSKQSEELSKLPNISLPDGTVLNGCRASKRDETTVSIIHVDGISKVAIADLTEKMKKDLKFDEIPFVATPKSEPRPIVPGPATPSSPMPADPAQGEVASADPIAPGTPDSPVDSATLAEKVRKIEEVTKQAVSESANLVLDLKKKASESERAFVTAGGMDAMKAMRADQGKPRAFFVIRTLLDGGFEELGTEGENVYEVNFAPGGEAGIVVTEEKIPSGGKGTLFLHPRKGQVKVTLQGGGTDLREVYDEARPNLDDPISALYRTWQEDLENIEDAQAAADTISGRASKALETLRCFSELAANLSVPQLILSPMMQNEGFSAAIQDRTFNEVTKALRVGNLELLDKALDSHGAIREMNSEFAAIENFSPAGNDVIPDGTDVERLFERLSQHRFRVELIPADRRYLKEKNDYEASVNGRACVYIPQLPQAASNKRRSNVRPKQTPDCRVEEIHSNHVDASGNSFVVEAPVFSCSAIAFTRSERRNPRSGSISVRRQISDLEQTRDKAGKAAQENYEAGRQDENARDAAIRVAYEDHIRRVRALIMNF